MDAYALGIFYECVSYRLGGFSNGWGCSCGRFGLSRCCLLSTIKTLIHRRKMFSRDKIKTALEEIDLGLFDPESSFLFLPPNIFQTEQEERGKTYILEPIGTEIRCSSESL